MHRSRPHLRRGFTLIELMVVVVLVAVVLAIGLPNFKRYIVQNRLKASTAQMVSDLQFARSEAAARNTPVYWRMAIVVAPAPVPMTCYTIYTTTNPASSCNCGNSPPCSSSDLTEIKTVQFPTTSSIRIFSGVSSFAFDNVSGGIVYGTSDYTSTTPTEYVITSDMLGETNKKLRTTVSPAGRPTVCTFGAAPFTGYPVC